MAIFNQLDNSLMKDIVGVSYAGKPKDNTMMYITKKVEHLLLNLKDTKSALVFLEQEIIVPDDMVSNNTYVMCVDPVAQYTAVVLELDRKRNEKLRKMKYTLTAEGYWLGENVEIGEGTYIEPGVLIDHGVKIGKNCMIKSGAKIRFDTVIGDNCSVGENTVIGEPGFNVADAGDKKALIPCFGGVRICDNVSIGANVSISKGTAGITIFEDNVFVDSGSRVGHDVILHCGVEARGKVNIGGYTEVGSDSVLCSSCVLKNRIKLGEDVFVGMGSALIRNLKSGSRVFGIPAKTITF